MPKYPFYYELCDKDVMISYPFFMDKLKLVENICRILNIQKYTNQINTYGKLVLPVCKDCSVTNYYLTGNIFWSDMIHHMITIHNMYPSEYFIKVILATYVVEGVIVNPPLILSSTKKYKFKYIPVHRNKLLILDALMNQGSYPRYQNGSNFLFSEHSGVVTLRNNVVDNIIVFTNTDRIDRGDDRIFLPNNSNALNDFEYLFHTHPNSIHYGGRLKEGILYEFPSAGDIFNYIKYHNEGKALASVIVAPEGAYVIRQLIHQKNIDADPSLFHVLRKFIIKLEKSAVRKYNNIREKISDPDYFHAKISSNYEFIKLYNKFIKPINLIIEYYPREKINGEWTLRQFYLQYV